MKIYFLQNGQIIKAAYASEYVDESTMSLFSVLEIDEAVNATTCFDLSISQSRLNMGRESKYYISGEILMEREDWVEYVLEVL